MEDPLDAEARFTAAVPQFAGMQCKEADKSVIKWLKENGKLVHQGTINHSYPFCERTDTPLIAASVQLQLPAFAALSAVGKGSFCCIFMTFPLRPRGLPRQECHLHREKKWQPWQSYAFRNQFPEPAVILTDSPNRKLRFCPKNRPFCNSLTVGKPVDFIGGQSLVLRQP